MNKDLEKLSNYIIKNYTYTIDKKFREQEDYIDENFQDSFMYVLYFTDKISLWNDLKSIYIGQYYYKIDIETYIDRTNPVLFHKSLSEYFEVDENLSYLLYKIITQGE